MHDLLLFRRLHKFKYFHDIQCDYVNDSGFEWVLIATVPRSSTAPEVINPTNPACALIGSRVAPLPVLLEAVVAFDWP